MKSYLTVFTAILVFSGSEAGKYNYSEVIHNSLLFYEAQRSGKLPADNRISWRGDSMLDDGKDVGHDLTGGYHDAGDLIKFSFPLGFTLTVLSWGAIDYEDAYTKAGELENVRKAIKWGTDFLIKCRTSEDELYGQVGKGEIDHANWGRPEDWPKDKERPSYKVTSKHGGSDLAGETSAAFAAASIVFKKADPIYSSTLLNHAKSVYTFADKYRDTYMTEIIDAKIFYTSWSGYGDELAWSAAWLLRATNDSSYEKEVDKHFKEFSKQLNGNPGNFSWDDKTAGAQVLMAEITNEEKYKNLTKTFCDYIVNKAHRTPKGMAYIADWGSLCVASNVAFICLQAAKIHINSADNVKFAQGQIGYALGDTGRSFVVGYGVNPPTHEHHRAASCPTTGTCSLDMPGANAHVLTGALVGGPDENDTYVDVRSDYVHNEVALVYNAGFQSSVAALLHLEL